jgi:hypothetical protein
MSPLESTAEHNLNGWVESVVGLYAFYKDVCRSESSAGKPIV